LTAGKPGHDKRFPIDKIPKVFSIYVARDGDGRVTFVGKTRHYVKRSEEHEARGWHCEELGTVEDPWKARLVEQNMIIELCTGPSERPPDG
jgi:hypothetical protein